MMDSRERVKKVLRFEEVDRIPRDIWALPGVRMYRKEELDMVLNKYSVDFATPDFKYGEGYRSKGVPYVKGKYTDAWGCVWDVGEDGVVGEVKGNPLSEWKYLDSYKLPWELLDNADMSNVNKSCEKSTKFMIIWTETKPFERMQFLRGTENLYMDLAYGDSNVYKLRDMLHEFYLREIEMWANTDVDAVTFSDDWGSQKSLLISPELWREFYKPLYKDYCDILRSKGKYVFFHSDGNIESIYPDLIEIGVNAINSQLFCMDIEKLGNSYAGKIAFWGEIDRQYILPFGTTEDARNAVRRVAKAMLKDKRTGIIAQFEWGIKDPIENVLAILEEWEKY